MRRKSISGFRPHSEVIDWLKKSCEVITSTISDENQIASKKAKYDAQCNNENGGMEHIIKLTDERVEDVLNAGIRIYHKKELSGERYSDMEKFNHLTILKKIQDPKEWLQRRIFSNRQQLQCLLGKEIVKKEERKDALSIVDQWIEYKVASFPAKFKRMSCEDLAIHYRNRFNLAGLEYDKLLAKVNECSHTNDVKSSANSTTIPEQVSSQSQALLNCSNSSSLPSIIQDSCRLCGANNCTLVISVHKKYRDASFKSLIEYFCHVDISDDDRLPQFVCIDCKNTLDHFSQFASKVMSHQRELNDNLPSSTTTAIKMEMEEFNEHPITIDDTIESPEASVLFYSNCTSNVTENFCESPDESMLVAVSKNIVTNHNNNNEIEKNLPYPNHHCQGDLPQSSTTSTASSSSSSSKTTQLSKVDLTTIVKSSFVNLYRLPIVFCPSDTESDDDIEAIFPKGFLPATSSPNTEPKCYIKQEPPDESMESVESISDDSYQQQE